MLDTLITSKTRIKLLLKFFLNSKTRSYLRGLAEEFGESSNAIRVELNRMEEAGLLSADNEGNKKMYQANVLHPLFNDIHNIILKHVGIDKVIQEMVIRVGEPDSAWLVGDFAEGKDGKIIDLILVGEDLDKNYLNRISTKVEAMIKRKVRYMVISPEEASDFIGHQSRALMIWRKDQEWK
ncbi:ArsR family transcriptional regulator [Prolixibacteraceae bacterium JC049]|nr:ArsR family transcriptional regulator [Prolixibacteraceae bacterium JC049]